MDTKAIVKEIEALCHKNIEEYEPRVQHALNVMDRMRCPLSMADPSLADEIDEQMDEWMADHDWTEEQQEDFLGQVDNETILFYCD